MRIGQEAPLLERLLELSGSCPFVICTMMYRWVSDRRFSSRNGYRPGSFRFRKRIERLPGRGSPVCDNTPLGICVSRSNAVSARQRGRGPPANRRLVRDRHEIGKVIDGNRERATRCRSVWLLGEVCTCQLYPGRYGRVFGSDTTGKYAVSRILANLSQVFTTGNIVISPKYLRDTFRILASLTSQCGHRGLLNFSQEKRVQSFLTEEYGKEMATCVAQSKSRP